MMNAAEVTGLNSAVEFIEAECERLPEPYGSLVKGALALVLPVAVSFLVKKFGAPSVGAVAQPAAPAPAVPQS